MTPKRRDPDRIRTFTPRESEIVYLLAQHGWANSEIAIYTGLAKNTVRTHVDAVLRKTGMHSRVALVSWAWRSGWVDAYADEHRPKGSHDFARE